MVRQLLKHIGPYEWIAFLSGFTLLAFELVASRLLAPAIGTSTYVWTSVIGVIIAALAFGYTFGGYIADKRTKASDVAWLLIAAAGAISLTLFLYRDVLGIITSIRMDPRLGGVLASIMLFLPASFLMGAVSPYLARLRTSSLETAGRSIAGLSAANSLGGISGTFIAGFFLFSWIGSRQTLGLLVIILLASSWLVTRSTDRSKRIAISIIIVFVTAGGLFVRATNSSAEIDTPSAHYEVIETQYNKQPIVALTSGPSGLQSGVAANGSKQLVFNYTQKLADLVTASPHKDKILIIGGGTFTLPEYLAKVYPGSTIDAVEIDGRLASIARQYFYYSDPPNVRIIAADGRAYLNQTNQQYDIIIIDAYTDDQVPFTMATSEFADRAKQRLRPDGILLANFIASTQPDCAPLLNSYQAAYGSAFQTERYFPLLDATFSTRQNIIALYSNANIRWSDTINGASQPQLQYISVPTDNFSKIEQFSQQCSA